MKVIIFILSIILCSYDIDAQVVQLGSGTTTNSITQASPVNIYYRRQLCQIVYTTAEINAAGANGANILSQLGFYVTNQPVYAIPDYTIKVKHTTASNAGSSLGSTGWTTVKTAYNYSPSSGGYDMIAFDTPFNWDGIQNIGIEICWSQVQPGWNSSGQCRTYAATNGYNYVRDDNAGSICGSSPQYVSSNKPQVQLTFKTSTTWNGSSDSDWFNDTNWDAGTPDENLDVEIPSGITNMPIILADGAKCKGLTIDENASLTVDGTNGIDIYGDWTINGSFTSILGDVTLRGSSANNITVAENLDLYNLIIDNDNGAGISSGEVNINGTLKVTNGNFNTNNSLTLISNTDGTARIDRLSAKCNYTLDMYDDWGDGWNGGYLTISIDGIVEGTFFAQGFGSSSSFMAFHGSTIQLDYTSGSYENENSYILSDDSGNQLFTDGPTPAVGLNVFSTTSICTFTNPIIGTITMQRYIDAGSTNWRFLSSAISGTTLADFNDDFITSGFIGSDYPNWPSSENPWPSIYFYNETEPGDKDSGFVAATNVTNSVPVGAGIWAWSGDAMIGTQPFTIDVTGTPNVGDIAIPLSYTNYGLISDDGWNMIGNPFPSTIDWDSPNITKTAINDAIHIFNPNLEVYASYVNGIGINGGSQYISSSQAFWIQANASSTSITVTEACKSAVNASFLKQANSILPLRIKVQNNIGSDEIAINFNPYATNGFDPLYDAKKFESINPSIPSISSNITSVNFAINQLAEQEVNIPIKILTGSSGFHNIQIENAYDFSNNSSCLLLEDLFTGIIYDLNTINSFTAYIYDSTTIARFLLHIGAPYYINTTNVSCQGSADAKIVYTKNSSSAFDIVWKNNLGNVIYSNTNIFSDSISNLSEGLYTIETTDAVCGNSIDSIEVTAPSQITSYFVVTNDTIYLSNGGNITFNNQSINATNYLWDFNDGFNSTLHSPSHTFNIPGNYLVDLTASTNVNCFENYSHLITVISNPTSIHEKYPSEEINAWIKNNVLTIDLANNDYNFIKISNVLGQIIYQENNPKNLMEINVNKMNTNLLLITLISSNQKAHLIKLINLK